MKRADSQAQKPSREECRRQMDRPLALRVKCGFCRADKPVLDDAPPRRALIQPPNNFSDNSDPLSWKIGDLLSQSASVGRASSRAEIVSKLCGS